MTDAVEGQLVLPQGSRAAGAGLRFKYWPGEGAEKAVVLIAHGYAEHLGRYEHVAAALTRAGFAVFAIDHWGHGKSEGEPGFVPAFSVYLDGLDALLAEAKATHADKPFFLVGHSMGGLIAANFLPSRQAEFAGAILSGASIKAVDDPSPLLLMVGRVLSKLAPKAGLIPLDPTLVSRDPEVVADYIADPLVYNGKISARLGSEMIDAMSFALDNAAAVSIPLLILHGGADGLTAPEGSVLLNDRAASSDKTLKIYDGFYHEIFNDPDKEDVIAGMIGWLNAHA